MAKCFICSKSAKTTLADKAKVCTECWLRAGMSPSEPGYGGFAGARVDLTSEEFRARYQSETSRANEIEGDISESFSCGRFGYVGFNDEKRIIIMKRNHHVEDGRRLGLFEYEVFEYSQIVDVRIVSKSTATSHSSHGVGRAVAGGLLFGVAGAVVGATTAKGQTVISTDEDIMLGIREDDGSIRSIRIPGRQDLIVKLGEVLEPRETALPSGTADVQSEIDAIMRYKELLDAGIITEEEFQHKKARILGV